jgi:hypothetical protein
VSGAGEVGLLDFLLARLAEDRAAARACAAVYPPPWELSDRGWVAYVKADAPAFREVARLEQGTASGSESRWLGEALDHVARWDPARVLAECEVKWRIVEAYREERNRRDIYQAADPHSEGIEQEKSRRSSAARCRGLEIAVELLALPYVGHKDFRAEWQT